MPSNKTPLLRLTIPCALICLTFGCSTPPDSGTQQQPTPAPIETVKEPEPAPVPAPVTPPPVREVPPPKSPPPEPKPVVVEPQIPAAQAVAERLAKQLRLARSDVAIVQVTPANWPDSCLGLPAEGEICAMVITPGYAVSLTAAGQRYEFRTDESGKRVRLASAPLVEAGETLLTWRDSQSFSVLVIGTEKVAFGNRGGPMLNTPPPNPVRARELLYFLGTFAPIQQQTHAGEIVLRSVGTTVATEPQRRMIAEWARLVRDEARNGLSEPAEDRLLVWQRTGGIAGFCNEVVIGRTGIATGYDCSSGDSREMGRINLESDELAELYRWADGYEPYSWESEPEGSIADAMFVTLEFNGTGVERLTDTKPGELLDFVEGIVGRLMTQPPGE